MIRYLTIFGKKNLYPFPRARMIWLSLSRSIHVEHNVTQCITRQFTLRRRYHDSIDIAKSLPRTAVRYKMKEIKVFLSREYFGKSGSSSDFSFCHFQSFSHQPFDLRFGIKDRQKNFESFALTACDGKSRIKLNLLERHDGSYELYARVPLRRQIPRFVPRASFSSEQPS